MAHGCSTTTTHKAEHAAAQAEKDRDANGDCKRHKAGDIALLEARQAEWVVALERNGHERKRLLGVGHRENVASPTSIQM